jgi:PAS domain S-box-containing protein
MLTIDNSKLSVCLTLTTAISRSRTTEQIYTAALDALESGLGVAQASILLFDSDRVMRFKAWRGLTDRYRAAVEGHTPWTPETGDAQPIVVSDVRDDPSLKPYLPTIQAEGIAAMSFIPLVSVGRVIGKFMLYYREPHALSAHDLQLAGVIAAQVAFAVERTRAEENARRSEERLRFALDAASMGTWDWSLPDNLVQWSDNLERLHGLPPGTFDGTFESYEREIHPDDRERVLLAARRAIELGVPYDVEYRMVAPDGTVRWVEGKGRVEYENSRPVRMTGVCMLITRRKEAELARLASAEETNRAKDEFLATLSHELRTPLNAILGWVQVLRNDGSPDRIGRPLDIIGRNARLQAQLIEDILDVSRIISGKLEMERVPAHAAQVVDNVINGLLPVAQAKQIVITRTVADHLPPMEGDPQRLQQAFNNIVANAIKFTPEGGTIAVTCRPWRAGTVVEVTDSGVGIAPEFLPHVFERFRQGDSRTTRKHGGLGLGLAIARFIIEEHGGTIEAESPGVDQGTTIRVVLPGANVSALDPRSSTVERCHPDLCLEGTTVLVVDDQQDSGDLLVELLTRRGARVLGFTAATAVIGAIDRTPTQLLIADIAMPDVDGYELIRRVRERHPRVPAIAVSAYARPQDRKRAIDAGYNAYCAKPIDAGQLLRTVRDVLAAGA